MGHTKYVKLDFPNSTSAMFKCDVRPIGIETNGYKGEAIEDRICKICDMSEIENNEGFYYIVHFLVNKKIIYFTKLYIF